MADTGGYVTYADETTIGDEVSSSEQEEGSVAEDPILHEDVVGSSTVAVETPAVAPADAPADAPSSSNAEPTAVATKRARQSPSRWRLRRTLTPPFMVFFIKIKVIIFIHGHHYFILIKIPQDQELK